MDVVATSLEALIQRATNPQNEKPDVAAMEAFCVTLGKESRGIDVASRLLATHVQASSEKEALQALTLLDTCMKRCGRSFRAEIGKFRFLNTMIKLVSPKYLGDETPEAVRVKILDLLYAWTKDYPREAKIRETYEMLKRQGVIKERQERPSPALSVADSDVDADAASTLASKTAKLRNPIFEDEEKTKLLQELLQSKDPFDLKLANRLIKSMVKEDEKRLQINCQRNMQLESVCNNVKLLSEMLDSYEAGNSSAEDVELMKELCDACERLKPTLSRLASETRDNDAEMLGEVLAASDQLTQVIEKYASIVVLGQRSSSKAPTVTSSSSPSLLDLSSPSDAIDMTTSLSTRVKNDTAELPPTDSRSNIEVLGDIFNSLGNPPAEQFPSASTAIDSSPLVLPDANIMQPISIVPANKALASKPEPATSVKLDGKAKALEDLNQLGEWLLKQSLSKNSNDSTSLANARRMTNDTEVKRATEVSMVKPARSKDEPANGLVDKSSSIIVNGPNVDFVDLLNDDDAMLDASSLSVEKKEKNVIEAAEVAGTAPSSKNSSNSNSSGCSNSKNVEIKPLTDIHVTLDDIEPGTTPPLTVIKEKNGISVVLHFAKGSPRADVSVIVVTTTSKNTKTLTNYLVQAVVSENCKCRLEGPSDTRLPAHNPFLPPAAITQIMLIANPRKIRPSLKLMLSYTMESETFTEMGEVDELPVV